MGFDGARRMLRSLGRFVGSRVAADGQQEATCLHAGLSSPKHPPSDVCFEHGVAERHYNTGHQGRPPTAGLIDEVALEGACRRAVYVTDHEDRRFREMEAVAKPLHRQARRGNEVNVYMGSIQVDCAPADKRAMAANARHDLRIDQARDRLLSGAPMQWTDEHRVGIVVSQSCGRLDVNAKWRIAEIGAD